MSDPVPAREAAAERTTGAPAAGAVVVSASAAVGALAATLAAPVAPA